jgi:hypothetical protein
MSRWVVPARAGLRAGTGEEPDGILSRVVKYVPVEIVAPYTMLETALITLNTSADQRQLLAIGLILLFLLVTIIHVIRNTHAKVRQAHLIVSPCAFLAWAYPISSAALGDLFMSALAFGLQALVIALAIVIAPQES